MNQDTVAEMPSRAARQREPFTVASQPEKVCRGVEVLRAYDFLVDDGAGIEIGRHVVTGGADEFHSAFVSTLIRIGPDEGG